MKEKITAWVQIISCDADFCFTGTGQEQWSTVQRVGVFDPSIHPDLLPTGTLLLFRLRYLTSSFALVIITTTTRGHRLTISINMGHNKLLPRTTYTRNMCVSQMCKQLISTDESIYC